MTTPLPKDSIIVDPDMVAAVEPKKSIGAKNILWPVALSLASLIVIGWLTFDADAIGHMLDTLNYGVLAGTLGVVVLRVVFGGWRLSYISHQRINLKAGIKGQLAWDFFSYVTPSTIGGGPFAAVFISRDQNLALGETTSLMLFSMLLDQIWAAVAVVIVLVSTAFWHVFPSVLGTVGSTTIILYFIGLLGWTTLFAYATLFRPELISRLSRFVFKIKWLRRFQDKVNRELTHLHSFTARKRAQPFRFYLTAFSLSVASMMGRYLLPVMVIWSVYPTLDIWLALLRSIAMSLGAMALPTPGGAGGIEGLFALFLGPLFADVRGLMGPVVFTWRLLGYYSSIVVGVFITMRHVQKSAKKKGDGSNK